MRIDSCSGLALALALAASCGGGGDDESYDTFQACFDDHHGEEGYDAMQAITICTLDHPVKGVDLEFATAAECVTYVTANLTTGSATTAEIQAGCDDYITQKGK